MDRLLMLAALLPLGLTLSSCSQPPPRQYHYVSTPKNWTEARQFCREKYTDLATFDSMDDLSRLKADFSYSWAWIGLWDDPENWRTSMGNDTNSWRWSATGETSRTGYQNWHPSHPYYAYQNKTCVVTYYDGTWFDTSCEGTRGFICYNVSENNKKNYFHIPTSKTWQSAQQHCREHFTDLATIENEAENTEAFNATLGTSWYWIGLYRNPWTWSDRSQSSFRNRQPTYYNGHQHCVSENIYHEWIPNDCGSKFPFICHQVVGPSTVFRMTTEADVDLSDPHIQSQVLQKVNHFCLSWDFSAETRALKAASSIPFQMEALLRARGLTDVKLQWRMKPKKKD
ncbi:putative C-type lectin domain family 20 member A [Menidia menidia]